MNNYTNPVTVTGNPASFEASGSGKLLSLSVPFSPIQDLHGYANPWPAGGGKNKFEVVPFSVGEMNGITFTYNSDGSVTVNGTATARAYKYLRTYSAGWFPIGTTYTFRLAGVPSTASAAFLNFSYSDNGTTYAGSYGTLTYEGTKTITSAHQYNSVLLDIPAGQSFNNNKIYVNAEVGTTASAWTPYSNICPISGRTGLSVYVSPTQDVADATTYAIDWTSEAGTVYGGTLDVVTGVLTIDRIGITPSVESLQSINAYGIANFAFSMSQNALNTQFAKANAISNVLKTQTSSIASTTEQGIMIANATSGYVRLDSAVASTAEQANTWISDNGLLFVYYLATPLTYQLTPTQIALILGQNYVWSDSNEAVTLTYVIELFTRYTFIVNGNDYTGLVERDSYRTAVMPVYGETIQTLDGVGHTALLRVKGSLTVKLNPQTAAQTAAICADLLNAPCEVQYKCLQRNVNVTALMVLDAVSAMFLSRCLYLGQKWNDVDEIVLKEL